MSSKKTGSEPSEKEGTGVPADDAAEHTTSDSSSSDSTAATPEPADSGDTAAGAAEKSADPDTTEKVAEPDSDATVKVDKSADPDATVKVDKSADPDATVKVDKPGDSDANAETVSLGKAEAGDSGDPAGRKASKPAGSADADPAAGQKKSSGLRSTFPLPVLVGAAVLLVAALVAVGVFFFLANDRQDELDRRAAATKAACDFGNSFATYTGDKADDYVQRLDQTATGEWKKLVAQIGPDLKARFAETQVNSTASGVQCGFESGEGDKARVVLVIDQQFTTVGGPQQQAPGQVKVAANVEMEKVDGRWLVADFDTPMMQQ